MLEFEQKVLANEVCLLQLRGRLDALTALELRPTIDALVNGPTRRVVCDFGRVTMIDSSGVGAIVSLFKRQRMVGGDVKIAGLSGQPREIFRLLRLDRAFEVFGDAHSAAASFD